MRQTRKEMLESERLHGNRAEIEWEGFEADFDQAKNGSHLGRGHGCKKGGVSNQLKG